MCYPRDCFTSHSLDENRAPARDKSVYFLGLFAVLESAHSLPPTPHSHGQYFYFQITKDEYEPFISFFRLVSYANSGCSGSGLVFALPPK